MGRDGDLVERGVLPLDGMTGDEMRQVIVDGCSAGMGLEAILQAEPRMPSLAEVKARYPEISEYYLEQKAKWAPARAAVAGAMEGIAAVRSAIAATQKG